MKLASSCVYLFFALLAYVFLAGGETRYIVETGFSAVGTLIQNFFTLATFTDPQRNHLLPSDLDHVLLGLLDGVGGGRSILYWKYL